jgi:hypothetical protein
VTEKMKAKDYLGGLFPVSGRPKALEPKEAGISKAIEDYLNRLHVYTDRMNAGSVEVIKRFKRDGIWTERRNWMRLAKKGTPDRFFIMSGRIFFIEVKMRGKRPTPEQLERHQELRRAGARIIVTDGLGDFIKQFKEMFGLG